MITRDNYEEFFLLYTDNELSAAERHAVERFVSDHPDLREEWEALLQCKLSPDTQLSFPDRSSLLKPEAEGSPYTGDLLSYLDNELDAAGVERIDIILGQQPLIARALATLRQTVSHPDPTVVFPDKDLLYRPEKNRRIVPLPWLRAGIAATIIAAVALTWMLSPRPQPVIPVKTIASAQHAPASAKKIDSNVTLHPVAALHLTEGSPKQQKKQQEKRMIQRSEPSKQQDVAANNKPVSNKPIGN